MDDTESQQIVGLLQRMQIKLLKGMALLDQKFELMLMRFDELESRLTKQHDEQQRASEQAQIEQLKHRIALLERRLFEREVV